MSFKRILLIKPSGRHGLSFAFDIIPTGLEYIAAYVEDVVDEVNIIDLEMEPKPIQKTVEKYLNILKPDLVGISMSATEHSEGLQIARFAKNKDITTVLGGYHPTAVPDELLSHPQVDIIVRGEGEHIMHELITKGDAKCVNGVSYKEGKEIIHNPNQEFIEDLDSFPFPARHLRRYTYHNTLMQDRKHDVLTTSRGCWGRCSFCCEPHMSNSHQRYRSPENVIDEIFEIVKFHNEKPLSIEVTDPHFMGNPKLVERFCDILSENDLDIRFGVKVRPDSIAKHPEIVRKMIAAGIEGFEMGIESPNMKDINSTSKGLKTDVHVKAANNIRKWGGSAGGTFVIGLPEQTEDEILKFPEYAKKIGLTSSAYGIATPYPGTKFYDDLNSQGLIFETDWNKFDEMHSVFKTKHLSSKRTEELASICMAKFWTIDTFIEKERIRKRKYKTKTPLTTFIANRLSELTFSVDAGSQLQGGNFSQHAQEFLEASPDPVIKRYTETVGMHNVIEMSRFLRLLGDQTIQVTVKNNGTPPTSWIFKTTKDTVEHIQVIQGKLNEITINFNVNIQDFQLDGQQNLSQIDNLRIVVKLLSSNKGIKQRFNMMRLFAAGGIEFIKYLGTKKHFRWYGLR
ncbi:MAG: cobalamin-dependent protein [Candidatus Thermoplasmatota archaeon]|nr:cobalamin-dependent protein [Candidatus Thermoplasmatota archaeon]